MWDVAQPCGLAEDFNASTCVDMASASDAEALLVRAGAGENVNRVLATGAESGYCSLRWRGGVVRTPHRRFPMSPVLFGAVFCALVLPVALPVARSLAAVIR